VADLGLERVAVVYPGDSRYPLADEVEVVPVSELARAGGLFPGAPAAERVPCAATAAADLTD